LGSWVCIVAVTLVVGCSSPAKQPPIADGAASRSCPTQLDLEVIPQGSRFDAGFSGLAHGVGLSAGSVLTVNVSSCDADCRRCEFSGPTRADLLDRPVINQRCLDDYTKPCRDDLECGSPGACRYMFPPIPAKAGTIDSCALIYFQSAAGPPVAGVIDLLTGETDLSVFDMVIDVVVGTCTVCDGDVTPFDGVQNGRCLPTGPICDVHGVGTSVVTRTSFDCPSTAPALLSIPIPGGGTTTTSRVWTMDTATRPLCTASGATLKRCWCGVCNDGTPCTSNTQCAVGTCGAATVGGLAISTNNHACPSGGSCIWNAVTQRGTCSTGTPPKACFPDMGSILARGSAEASDNGSYTIQLANLLCLPSFGGLLDPASGFPGPVYFQARFKVTPRTVTP
jgi:hypothetical protein